VTDRLTDAEIIDCNSPHRICSMRPKKVMASLAALNAEHA